ncbi:MAG: TRAP transporter small permease [Pseudomonadota bacterium]
MPSVPPQRNVPQRVLGLVSQLCTYASAAALVFLVIIFGWLVFGRYVLNETPTWVEQMSLLLVGYIAFVGGAAGVHDDTHLGVTLFRDALGAPFSDIAAALADIVMAGFGLVMLLACIELMQFGWDTKLPMLNIPESFRTLPAAFCGALTFVFAGARAITRLAGLAGAAAPRQGGDDR